MRPSLDESGVTREDWEGGGCGGRRRLRCVRSAVGSWGVLEHKASVAVWPAGCRVDTSVVMRAAPGPGRLVLGRTSEAAAWLCLRVAFIEAPSLLGLWSRKLDGLREPQPGTSAAHPDPAQRCRAVWRGQLPRLGFYRELAFSSLSVFPKHSSPREGWRSDSCVCAQSGTLQVANSHL